MNNVKLVYINEHTQNTLYNVDGEADVVWAGEPKVYECSCGKEDCDHIQAVKGYWQRHGSSEVAPDNGLRFQVAVDRALLAPVLSAKDAEHWERRIHELGGSATVAVAAPKDWLTENLPETPAPFPHSSYEPGVSQMMDRYGIDRRTANDIYSERGE